MKRQVPVRTLWALMWCSSGWPALACLWWRRLRVHKRPGWQNWLHSHQQHGKPIQVRLSMVQLNISSVSYCTYVAWMAIIRPTPALKTTESGKKRKIKPVSNVKRALALPLKNEDIKQVAQKTEMDPTLWKKVNVNKASCYWSFLSVATWWLNEKFVTEVVLEGTKRFPSIFVRGPCQSDTKS